jgi:hypothetical protein
LNTLRRIAVLVQGRSRKKSGNHRWRGFGGAFDRRRRRPENRDLFAVAPGTRARPRFGCFGPVCRSTCCCAVILTKKALPVRRDYCAMTTIGLQFFVG